MVLHSANATKPSKLIKTLLINISQALPNRTKRLASCSMMVPIVTGKHSTPTLSWCETITSKTTGFTAESRGLRILNQYWRSMRINWLLLKSTQLLIQGKTTLTTHYCSQSARPKAKIWQLSQLTSDRPIAPCGPQPARLIKPWIRRKEARWTWTKPCVAQCTWRADWTPHQVWLT